MRDYDVNQHKTATVLNHVPNDYAVELDVAERSLSHVCFDNCSCKTLAVQ